jgi:hypothetical protein
MTRLQKNELVPEATLLTAEGTTAVLSPTLWHNGPTLLTFLRHFG